MTTRYWEERDGLERPHVTCSCGNHCFGGQRRECEPGQIIWWCENHEASAGCDGWFADELHCHVWWWGEAHPETPLLDPYDCSMTSRLLVDPPKEEE